ncbi:MAG: bifunctional phosphopantothenoylcysteine decarboxylase/phosphopantothenate--cysteine ligase CoaBC [Candidatus Thorarchaeota archaeon]|nr:bifunctional phosphopantothenoylcysteine decarboxylase/phosphopantothenate--cysteine ligase CoaBC [Candidatus Thorarchaeota archaeon]
MEHTSKLIIGSRSQNLQGRKIALCVTGSVAAVECVAIARLLMRHGAEVYCMMSPMAHKIIHPYLLEWATGNPCITELTGQIEHVTLAGKHKNRVDLVLIAPSTANTIGKIANGIDDTTVTTTASSAIGAGIPLVIVPAMHESMYEHPSVIENIEKLKEMGIHVMSPRREEAKAKIPTPESIVEHVIGLLGSRDFEGKRLVITAGPTRGWIDRVRFVTNPSSGKMGIELAREALARGAIVELILGPTAEQPPEEAIMRRVDTPDDMLAAVRNALADVKADAFISSAAVLDYMPPKKLEEKTPSGRDKLVVEFLPTQKIIEVVRKENKGMYIVGFKVESEVTDEELERRARTKIDAGTCDLMVANDAARSGVAFGGDTNEILIIDATGIVDKVGLTSKREAARRILDVVASKLE